MKKQKFSLVLILSLFMILSSLKIVLSAEASKTLKILSIGNSFSQDAQRWMYQIAEAAGYEDITIANLYWGGCSLKTHAKNAKADSGSEKYEYQLNTDGKIKALKGYTVKSSIEAENWDYITLQQASPDSGMEKTYNEDLDYLINFIKEHAKNPDVKIGWHMTWAYQQDSTHKGFVNYNNDQMTMYKAIVHCTEDIVMEKEDISFVFPAGTAIQNLRTSFIGDTLTRDGYHMSLYLGRYTVGLTWIYGLCKMMGNPLPLDITYTPSSTEVPEYYLPAIREAVLSAIENPFQITESSYKDISE